MCATNIKRIEDFILEDVTYVLTTLDKELTPFEFNKFLIDSRNKGLQDFNIARIVKIRANDKEVKLLDLIRA